MTRPMVIDADTDLSEYVGPEPEQQGDALAKSAVADYVSRHGRAPKRTLMRRWARSYGYARKALLRMAAHRNEGGDS